MLSSWEDHVAAGSRNSPSFSSPPTTHVCSSMVFHLVTGRPWRWRIHRDVPSSRGCLPRIPLGGSFFFSYGIYTVCFHVPFQNGTGWRNFDEPASTSLSCARTTRRMIVIGWCGSSATRLRNTVNGNNHINHNNNDVKKNRDTIVIVVAVVVVSVCLFVWLTVWLIVWLFVSRSRVVSNHVGSKATFQH